MRRPLGKSFSTKNTHFLLHVLMMVHIFNDFLFNLINLGSVNIFHATVHNDLMQNALIVPLKILNGHSVKEDLGVLDVKFHPNQPWIFSSGADHKIILWT